MGANDRPNASRPPAERAADHAAIQRLADDLVPALIAKLGASGLGEIEVGEDRWTIRVRRPADGSSPHNRRATDRPSRSQPGHAGHGHAPAGFEGHRSVRDGRPAGAGAASAPSGNGSSAAGGDLGVHRPTPVGDPHRAVATSPAVGVFQPRTEMTPGTRVRSGDRLGAVDMLGVPQEVVAPADGIIGANLVDSGDAVEYGQDLIVIELAGRLGDRPADRPADRSEA
jgi:biotin carboxyl carrier protein